MPHDLEGILFDMDGVLVDSTPVHAAAYHDAFAEVGVAFDPARFADEFAGTPRAEVIATVCAGRHSPDVLARVFARKGELARAHTLAHGAPEYPGVGALLEAIRAAGLRVALVTTSHDPEAFVGAHPWGRLFDAVVSGRDVDAPKPSPEPYATGLRQLALPAGRCLAVEDSPRGVLSATRAGLEVWAVTSTHPLTQLIDAGASRVFDGIADLHSALMGDRR